MRDKKIYVLFLLSVIVFVIINFIYSEDSYSPYTSNTAIDDEVLIFNVTNLDAIHNIHIQNNGSTKNEVIRTVSVDGPTHLSQVFVGMPNAYSVSDYSMYLLEDGIEKQLTYRTHQVLEGTEFGYFTKEIINDTHILFNAYVLTETNQPRTFIVRYTLSSPVTRFTDVGFFAWGWDMRNTPVQSVTPFMSTISFEYTKSDNSVTLENLFFIQDGSVTLAYYFKDNGDIVISHDGITWGIDWFSIFMSFPESVLPYATMVDMTMLEMADILEND
jgi:hypothetical protein